MLNNLRPGVIIISESLIKSNIGYVHNEAMLLLLSTILIFTIFEKIYVYLNSLVIIRKMKLPVQRVGNIYTTIYLFIYFDYRVS